MGQADNIVQLFQSHLDVAHIVHYLVLGMSIVVNILSLSVQIAGQSDASITLVSTHEHLQCDLFSPAGLYDCLQFCVRLLGHDSHDFYQILGTSAPPLQNANAR